MVNETFPEPDPKIDIDRELDEIPEIVEPDYIPGSAAWELKETLRKLVRAHGEPAGREQTLKFLDWVPGEALEKFLVLALDYGCAKTLKARQRPIRVVRAAGGPIPPVSGIRQV